MLISLPSRTDEQSARCYSSAKDWPAGCNAVSLNSPIKKSVIRTDIKRRDRFFYRYVEIMLVRILSAWIPTEIKYHKLFSTKSKLYRCIRRAQEKASLAGNLRYKTLHRDPGDAKKSSLVLDKAASSSLSLLGKHKQRCWCNREGEKGRVRRKICSCDIFLPTKFFWNVYLARHIYFIVYLGDPKGRDHYLASWGPRGKCVRGWHRLPKEKARP